MALTITCLSSLYIWASLPHVGSWALAQLHGYIQHDTSCHKFHVVQNRCAVGVVTGSVSQQGRVRMCVVSTLASLNVEVYSTNIESSLLTR